MKNNRDSNSISSKSVDVIAPIRNDDGSISISMDTLLPNSVIFNRPVVPNVGETNALSHQKFSDHSGVLNKTCWLLDKSKRNIRKFYKLCSRHYNNAKHALANMVRIGENNDGNNKG